MFGLLNDPYFVLLILFCAALITIGALVTALNRIPRAEFSQLQNEICADHKVAWRGSERIKQCRMGKDGAIEIQRES